MPNRRHWLRETFQMVLIGAATVAALVVGKEWPLLQYPAWALLFLGVAALLFVSAGGREPVNYESLRVADGVIDYVTIAQRLAIPLRDVLKLELVREQAVFDDLYGPYIESKWLLHTRGGAPAEIMDEQPHRKLLLQAFAAHLPGFNTQAAQLGFKASGEGRWLCYEAVRADLPNPGG